MNSTAGRSIQFADTEIPVGITKHDDSHELKLMNQQTNIEEPLCFVMLTDINVLARADIVLCSNFKKSSEMNQFPQAVSKYFCPLS